MNFPTRAHAFRINHIARANDKSLTLPYRRSFCLHEIRLSFFTTKVTKSTKLEQIISETFVSFVVKMIPQPMSNFYCTSKRVARSEILLNALG